MACSCIAKVSEIMSPNSNLALPGHDVFSRMCCVLIYFCANFKFSANLVDEGWSKICCDANFGLSSICDLAIWPRCDGDLSQGLVCFLRFETCDASCDGIAAICDAMRADAKENRPKKIKNKKKLFGTHFEFFLGLIFRAFLEPPSFVVLPKQVPEIDPKWGPFLRRWT